MAEHAHVLMKKFFYLGSNALPKGMESLGLIPLIVLHFDSVTKL